MFDASATALFPLPLTTFEKYMLLDDRPDYPMVFALQLKLSGDIHRPAFESSFEEALARHPLLCALVCGSWRTGLAWKLAEERRPFLDWDRIGIPIGDSRGERIDLRCEVGLRGWVRQGDGSVEATLQFHHACCDGLGAFQFLADLLAAYGKRTALEERPPTLLPCDLPSLLRREEHAAAAISAPKGPDRSIRTGIRDIARLLGRRLVVLGPSDAGLRGNSESGHFPEIFWHEFDPSETNRLGEAGARQSVTVNDLLVRDMFQCLQAWIAEQASESSSRWLRIAVPVSLRTGENDCSSAANQVSYNFLTRDRHRCDNAAELLRGISQENQPDLRRWRSLMFLRGFRCLSHMPQAIPRYMDAKRCFATVVLSNLGDISRTFGSLFSSRSGKIVAGNLVLESVIGAPPVRANTRAAFLVHRYDGRFTVCVRCDPRVFTPTDARRLLSLYVDRLKRTIDAA
jgi:hypothetical protein